MNGHRPQGYRTRLTGHLTYFTTDLGSASVPSVQTSRRQYQGDASRLCLFCSTYVLKYSSIFGPGYSFEIPPNPAEYLGFPVDAHKNPCYPMMSRIMSVPDHPDLRAGGECGLAQSVRAPQQEMSASNGVVPGAVHEQD